jgi:hypothetical protein
MVVDSIMLAHGYETDQHDLQILPDNHYLLFGIETRVMDLSTYHYFGYNHTQAGSANALVQGVVIQEFDDTKALIWEWKGHDYYQFSDVDPIWLFNPNKVDWTHANAVARDLDGNILISLRHFNEITKIDFATGDIIWRLGGKRNQFSFPNDPLRFTGQHDIRRVSSNTISLFDNGQYTNPAMCRGIEYELDEANKVATLVWEYIFDSSLYSVACGNHQIVENGNHLVDFGFTNDFSMPWMVVVKPDKTKILEVSMPDGYISYRAFNYIDLPWELHRPNETCRKTGEQYFLEAEAGHASYKWNTGETTASIPITNTGEYWVYVPYGMGFISSEHIRVSDLSNPCLFTSAESVHHPDELSVNCVFNRESNLLRVAFHLPETATVTTSVISLLGNVVETKPTASCAAGNHEFFIDVSSWTGGMYILSMQVDNSRMVRKVIIQ